jgi:hypothetical protein
MEARRVTPDVPGAQDRLPPSGRPTRATLWIDGARLTILPRRAPVGNSGPIRGRTLAIYPGTPTQDQFPAIIEPGGISGFAILDLDEGEAAKLGRTLGLTEILFWDGRRASLLPCAATPPPLPRQ